MPFPSRSHISMLALLGFILLRPMSALGYRFRPLLSNDNRSL
jgi:hypothetical protein